MTLVLLIALAVGLCAFVALPLLFPQQADPLPDYGDPVLRELQEERDALFRAIRELEVRDDLAASRRSELRARYEAKAAGVLRAIDEREKELGRDAAKDAERRPAPAKPGRVPYGALALAGLAVVTAATLSDFVFPRVSDDQTVTTFFQEDLEASQQLRDLRRAAERDPSTANLLALADAYWRLEDAEQAQETYQQVLDTAEPVPAVALRRLGFLALQDDLEEGAELLSRSLAEEPGHAETLFTLGEVHLALEDFSAARASFEAYLATAEGDGDATAQDRLALIAEIEPLVRAVQEAPTEENLLALADAYWRLDVRQRAVSAYFRILTEVAPDSVPALLRTGEALFLSGRPDDAIMLFERARSVAADQGIEVDPHALLLLGNAYFARGDHQAAIEAWEAHLARVDDPGRVPDLIESARARLAADDGAAGASAGTDGDAPIDAARPDAASATPASAQQLYAANCATCHGAAGQGGAGPALVGNPRARNAANVASIVRFGRGSMPGFGAVLDEAHLQQIVEYVTEDLARTASRAP